jgi:hypothetical protein
MFSAIRKRMHMSPATAIATLALVFAMTGGAYAASKVLITSTKQISPKVLKSLKGKAGVNGAQGPAGPAGGVGAQGAAGARGGNGAAGTNGKDGVSVTSGVELAGVNCKAGGSKFVAVSGTTYACNGEKGKNGTFEGQSLPEGKTLTGTYAAATFSEAGAPTLGFGKAVTGISFALPVAGELIGHYIKAGVTSLPAGCTGTVNEPGAEAGNLCVFSENEENLFFGNASIGLRGSPTANIGFEVAGLAAAKGNVYLSGTWAVTAG